METADSTSGLPERFTERYDFESVLGQGGCGIVVKAHDRQLRRTVAVKFMRGAAAEKGETAARFRREARLMAQVEHPNIVRLFDTELDGDQPYLVMEYVSGPSLARRLTEGPIPVDEALRLGVGILDGLAAAHERGIVHRDLKPANVLLDAAGVPRITDFGIAWAAEANTYATAAGVVVGTFYYVAPEVLMRCKATPAADLYAAGVVLFYMLYGLLPFTPADVLDAARGAPHPPPPIPPEPTVPVEVQEVLSASLSAEPSGRPESAAAFAAVLRKAGVFLGEGAAAGSPRPSRARRIPSRRMLAVAAPEGFPAAMPGDPPARKVSGRIATRASGPTLAIDGLDLGHGVGDARGLSGPGLSTSTSRAPSLPRRSLRGLAVLAGSLGLVLAAGAWWWWDDRPLGLALGRAVGVATGGSAEPAVLVSAGIDRLRFRWRTQAPARTCVRLTADGDRWPRESDSGKNATLDHTLTLTGLPPARRFWFSVESAPGVWTTTREARTLASDKGLGAAVLFETPADEMHLTAAETGGALAVATRTCQERFGRVLLSPDGGLTWRDAGEGLDPGRSKSLPALTASKGTFHLFWRDDLDPADRMRKAAMTADDEAGGPARSALSLPDIPQEPPRAVVRGNGVVGLLARVAPSLERGPVLCWCEPGTGGPDAPWAVTDLGVGTEPKVLLGPTLEAGGWLHVFWSVRLGQKLERLHVGSVQLGRETRMQPVRLLERRMHEYASAMAVSPAGTVMALYYHLPLGPAESEGGTGAETPQPTVRRAAAVFDDGKELSDGRVGFVQRRKGDSAWRPPEMFEAGSALGVVMGLAGAAGGFVMVHGDMDMFRGPGFLLSYRTYSEARGAWDKPVLIGPDPYGIHDLAIVSAADFLHVFVMPTFTRRLLYWRVPFKPPVR